MAALFPFAISFSFYHQHIEELCKQNGIKVDTDTIRIVIENAWKQLGLDNKSMLEWILKYWIEVLFGLLVGGAGFLFKSLFNKIADYNARQDAVGKGVQALLRNSIVQSYNHYMERGSITLHGLESGGKMYAEYHNLGGNGTVTKLVEDLREYPVMDKPPTRV